MSELEIYLSLLDLAHFEMGEAFKGLDHETLWLRPDDSLLSVGEMAGHVAFWQAVRFAGEGGEPWPEPAKCVIKSPLIDPLFAYYTQAVGTEPTDELLELTAEQVHAELKRIHEECKAHLRSLNPDLSTSGPGWPQFWTYRETIKYTIFHVSYHAGQMYSVRHLLGDETPDN